MKTIDTSQVTQPKTEFKGPLQVDMFSENKMESIAVDMDMNAKQRFVIPELPDGSACPEGTDLVFDIETQLSADDVGGWNRADKMRIAICVVYDIQLDRYEFYHEKDSQRLIDRLQHANMIIGYNSDRFDLCVLKGYAESKTIRQFNSLDLIHQITEGLGHRTGLGKVAAATVGAEKSADGLQSLKWWREGRIDLIAEYCRRDVEVTCLVYKYGKENGFIMHPHRSGVLIKVPVKW